MPFINGMMEFSLHARAKYSSGNRPDFLLSGFQRLQHGLRRDAINLGEPVILHPPASTAGKHGQGDQIGKGIGAGGQPIDIGGQGHLDGE